ncbi:MAG TPA: ABC transporter ATP-binding protein [Papillibacter sp.]|nr:ABC transporter ATP-binding protein [Papillibacter sp.]
MGRHHEKDEEAFDIVKVVAALFHRQIALSSLLKPSLFSPKSDFSYYTIDLGRCNLLFPFRRCLNNRRLYGRVKRTSQKAPWRRGKEVRNLKLLLRVAKETKGERGPLVAAMISTLLLTVLSLIIPRVQMMMIDRIEGGVDSVVLAEMGRMAALLVALFLLRVLLRYLSGMLAHKSAWKTVENVRVKLYAKIQMFDIEFFASAKTGDLMSRVTSDTAVFEQLFAHIIPESVTNAVTLIGVTVVLFSLNPRLAALTCIPIPFIVIGGYVFATKIRPIFRNVQRALGDINVRLHDNFAGIREIRAFGQEEREERHFHTNVAAYTKAMLGTLMKSSIFHPTIEFLTALGTVIVLGVGGLFAFRNQISVSTVVGFILYLSLFYAPITGLTQLLEQAQQALAAAERVTEILDEPVEIVPSKNAVTLEQVRGEMVFENVSFAYKDGVPVLKNVSFTARPGSYVALVGPTGVGKSTAVKLAARFYDPQSGRITIDGHDIRDVTLESLRKHIAYVPQDTFLFNMTIGENIAFACPDATQEEIVAAAKIARIHEDILQMPDGYDTLVGERGVKLSGGQKQRIAIARAVICGAPILILDEATSAVDVETEQYIRTSIDELSGDHTIIAIAHRLSTVRNADLILVLEDGEIVEQGTHDELLALGGHYAALCRMQGTDGQE